MILSEAASAQIADLTDRRTALFKQIEEIISLLLGYEPSSLTEEQRNDIAEEAMSACERWCEEAEMQAAPKPPSTPLQRLLKAHFELGWQMLDIFDEEAG